MRITRRGVWDERGYRNASVESESSSAGFYRERVPMRPCQRGDSQNLSSGWGRLPSPTLCGHRQPYIALQDLETNTKCLEQTKETRVSTIWREYEHVNIPQSLAENFCLLRCRKTLLNNIPFDFAVRAIDIVPVQTDSWNWLIVVHGDSERRARMLQDRLAMILTESCQNDVISDRNIPYMEL